MLGVRSAVVCCLLIVFVGCAERPPVKPEAQLLGDYEYVKQYIRWFTGREMRKQGVVGLSLALVDDQRVVWAEGFGQADRAKQVPATPDTMYRVGSITKLFTATSVMQLVERGLLDLDQPVTTYLPEFAVKTRFPQSTPITLRHLLTHHSGLPPNILRGMWSSHPIPYMTVLENLKETYVVAPPNHVFSYSNVGMSLVGAAIERVSGEPYASYVTRALLEPLGMPAASIDHGPASSPLMSRGYRDGKVEDAPQLRDLPAGGLNASVLDLAHLIQMVFAKGRAGNQQIVLPESLAAMLTPQNDTIPLDLDFHLGLGWMLSSLGEMDLQNVGTVAHHGGATFLFHSRLAVVPEHRLGVVVLCNSSTGDAAVSNIAKELLKVALEAKTGVPHQQSLPPDPPVSPMSPEQSTQFEGWYNTMAGLVKVWKSGQDLYADVLGKTFQVVPRSGVEFGLEYRLLGLFPIDLGDLGRVTLSRATVAGRDILIARQGRPPRMLVGEKITPTPIPQEWFQRLGTYDLVNAGDDLPYLERLRLVHQDGFLVLYRRVTRPEPFEMPHALAPLSNTAAAVMGTGFGAGETIDVIQDGGEERVRYAGYILRRKSSE